MPKKTEMTGTSGYYLLAEPSPNADAGRRAALGHRRRRMTSARQSRLILPDDVAAAIVKPALDGATTGAAVETRG